MQRWAWRSAPPPSPWCRVLGPGAGSSILTLRITGRPYDLDSPVAGVSDLVCSLVGLRRAALVSVADGRGKGFVAHLGAAHVALRGNNRTRVGPLAIVSAGGARADVRIVCRSRANPHESRPSATGS